MHTSFVCHYYDVRSLSGFVADSANDR